MQGEITPVKKGIGTSSKTSSAAMSKLPCQEINDHEAFILWLTMPKIHFNRLKFSKSKAAIGPLINLLRYMFKSI